MLKMHIIPCIIDTLVLTSFAREKMEDFLPCFGYADFIGTVEGNLEISRTLLVILLSAKYSCSYNTSVQLLTDRIGSSAADRQEVVRGISDLILSVILFFMATTNNLLIKSTGGS